MPKSYKITSIEEFNPPLETDGLLPRVKQRALFGVVPGPETHIRRSLTPVSIEDFESFDVEHEYSLRMEGRSFDTGEPFTRFIAKGQIKAYRSSLQALLLLSGKKSDILDFCKQTEKMDGLELKTLQVDMLTLQEKLPEVRGAWFRLKQGFIRAKGYMGDQIQSTTEFCEAKAEGEISTLSFYFLDVRDGCSIPS